ncbi:Hypothetical protein UVM_LOCUS37 [uncultured virus]|nr:Hypothetical protein UVM_LOCUS37 [uncultured virus]
MEFDCDEECQCAIVGAGPSGLAAAQALLDRGIEHFLVFESGSGHLERDRVRDITEGVGGAGLFSDGKFSFYPSATGVWTEVDHLEQAYAWLSVQLGNSVCVPPFPATAPAPTSTTVVVEPLACGKTDGTCEQREATEALTRLWRLKQYPSDYMDLESRMEWIGGMSRRIGTDRLRICTRVTELRPIPDGGMLLSSVSTTTDRSATPQKPRTTRAKVVFVAGGRFSPVPPSLPSVFRRFEYGLRVEFSSCAEPFEAAAHVLDPKYILRRGLHEYRTFCCCRRGEVIVGRNGALCTCSGRSDGCSGERSNFGYNVRVPETEAVPIRRLMLASEEEPFRVPVADVAALESVDLSARYTAEGWRVLKEGLRAVWTDVARTVPTAELVGPCLEGVGWYVDTLAGTLEVPKHPNVRVLGDATGRFRGIVAALLSGYAGALSYCATRP